MSKSQSMGFNRPGAVPDTHPYRGFLNAQQQQQQLQPPPQLGSMPRSNSMPLDKAALASSNGHAPPSDRSSPASTLSRGTGPSVLTSDDRGPALLPEGSPKQRAQAQAATPGTASQQPSASAAPSAPSAPAGTAAQPAWMNQFNAVVELIGMQPAKTYVSSPPELEMILAKTSAGGQPK
jgi:CCR4-NOT transcriptional complex subunit CAF120